MNADQHKGGPDEVVRNLERLGVPALASVNAIASLTRAPTATLSKAMKGSLIETAPQRGHKDCRLASREAWATFFASPKGTGIWERAARKRARKPAMSQAEFTAWYRGLDTTGEVWKPMPGSIDGGKWGALYSVSTLARIRRDAAGSGTRAGTILTPTLDTNGYPAVNLKRPKTADERQSGDTTGSHALPLRVHVAVAEAFLPKPVGDVEVLHIGPIHDARVHNLRWGTRAQNMAEVAPQLGADNGAAKFDDEMVIRIVALHEAKWTRAKIARDVGAPLPYISEIINGRKRSALTGIAEKAKQRRLSEQEKQAAMKMIQEGRTQREVAVHLGITQSAIAGFARRRGMQRATVDRVRPHRQPKRPITPAEVAEMARLRAAGLTFEAIGRQFGRAGGVVCQVLKYAGSH